MARYFIPFGCCAGSKWFVGLNHSFSPDSILLREINSPFQMLWPTKPGEGPFTDMSPARNKFMDSQC